MRARRQPNEVISALQAFVFAVALALALTFVLAPVLPGQTHLDVGEAAPKTFEAGGQVIVHEGDVVTQAEVSRIRDEGLLSNRISVSGVFAATIFGGLGAIVLSLYLYLFQPREVSTIPRLFMVGLVFVLWVAAAKVFLSLTLPDDNRLYLSYILPVAAAPMLTATLLDGGLGVLMAGLLSALAAFAGFAMPDARAALAGEPLDGLQMAIAFLLGGVAGIYAVRRAERVNHYAMAGVSVGLVTLTVLFAFWLLNPDRSGSDLVWMLLASSLTGLGSAIITVGATVVLGVIFGVTTRIQLMELAQLSHPLLRELQEKAPGTFHHSVIVGNLAARAADLVWADSLLVRVGCCFHDIGKIARPGY